MHKKENNGVGEHYEAFMPLHVILVAQARWLKQFLFHILYLQGITAARLRPSTAACGLSTPAIFYFFFAGDVRNGQERGTDDRGMTQRPRLEEARCIDDVFLSKSLKQVPRRALPRHQRGGEKNACCFFATSLSEK